MSALIQLFVARLPVSLRRMVLLALLWGLTTTLVVPLSNAVFDEDPGSLSWFGMLIGMVVILTGLYFTRRTTTGAALHAMESALTARWSRVGEHLSLAELGAIERAPGLRGRLISDLSTIGRTTQPLIYTIQCGAFLLSATCFVVLADAGAMAIWFIAFLGVALVVWPSLTASKKARGEVAREAANVHAAAGELVAGLAAIRLDRRVGDAVESAYLDQANALGAANQRAANLSNESFFRGLVVLYLGGFLPAAFADPLVLGLDAESAFALVMLLSQGLGPTLGLLHNIPLLLQASEAVERIEQTLGPIAGATAPGRLPTHFQQITLRGVRHHYPGGFGMGPVDLVLRPGERVFVTGGNGSGKSTLMKVLLGLYPIDGGRLFLDDRPVGAAERPAYRQLFTSLFNEVHLFDRLYGLTASTEDVVASLKRFGLEGIVDLQDGQRFSNLSLSTGQKKRLAMVVALLEDRPICVFDEWTANLDPETTRFYYDELLPELQRQGKTVVAVSHDDRYFDRADRILRMESGRIIDDRRLERPPADLAPAG